MIFSHVSVRWCWTFKYTRCPYFWALDCWWCVFCTQSVSTQTFQVVVMESNNEPSRLHEGELML